jgi:general secretion pathway protein A
MYTTFYGLTELPFELSPNPKYLLLTGRHREALANLQYGISAGKSVTLLLGEAGTGKTTLVQAALASDVCQGARIVHLANPMLTRDEFVEFLARAFNLPDEARRSKTTMLAELERELLARYNNGEKTALVIDEAQCLSRELLEEVRLLSNIETPGRKLMPIVLAGQPEFADRLNLPSLVQLKQRVALRCSLGLLDQVETSGYVNGRLKIAGANGHEIFSREALQVVHQRSGGVPRTVSVICDNALVSGFAANLSTIGAKVIHEVCDDFDLAGAERRPAPSPPAAEQGDVPPASPSPGGHPADRLFADYGKRRRFSFF